MAETEKRQKIDDLKEQIKVEETVSQSIRGFIEKKRGIIATKSDARDRLREKNIAKLEEVKVDIKTKDEESKIEIENMHNLCA